LKLKKTLDNLGGGSILILKDFGKTKLLRARNWWPTAASLCCQGNR
jgi:hypothetical protein